MSLGISVVDTHEEVGLGFIENVTPGQLSIPFDQLISSSFPFGVDLSSVDNIGLVIINQQGQEGEVTLGEFSTDGPIVSGPSVPGDGDDEIVAQELSGTYFDPARDGEGFMLSVEGDGSVFVMTWYTYLDGEQVWLIGVGTRNGNRLVFEEMVITSGAKFGSEFDTADVIRENFGVITVDFADCNNFTAAVDSILPEFHDIVLDVTKIVAGSCP